MGTRTSDPTIDAAPIRVAAGNPTPEELAALTAVVAAVSTDGGPARAEPRRAWTDPALRLGVQRTWRDSGLPR